MTTSIWLDGATTTRPELRGNLSTEVAILGAGMTGLAVAWYASQRGVPCVVLERGTIGCGASGRNAGIIITGLGEHYARSIARFGRRRAQQIWEINRANHALLRELLDEEGISCDYQQTGSFALGWDEAECADLSASVTPLEDDGFSAQLLAADEIRKTLGMTGCRLALYSAEDAQIHPVRLLQGLAESLSRCEVAIFECSPVLGIATSAGRPTGFRLEVPDGSVTCERLVLATNAYTPQLVRDWDQWITPVRGQCLAARAPESLSLPGPCYANRGHAYWRRFADRVIFGGFDNLSPETEHGYLDETTELIQRRLEAFAVTVCSGQWAGASAPAEGDSERSPQISSLKSQDFKVTHRWSGVMGYAKDWFPLIGKMPVGSGMYIAAGYTGHGFGYAFQAAKWVADALAGEQPAIPDFLSTNRILTPEF